ncbi:MAG TPA: M14 metallopeptidase family protein [Vicinamibacterales bacterium]|nr:M14 metallopeptidase family protein [Vicinamibacterales bacterium]
MKLRRAGALTLGALLWLASPAAAQVPTPDSHFGFRLGTDRRLATTEAIARYFTLVAATSDRVKLFDLGKTTEGLDTIAAAVSAPENIRNLDRIRAANQRLADPRDLPPDEARRLAATQKVIVAIGASIHASEVGAAQAASELLYTLAAASDAPTLNVLQNVVIVVIPSLNPDGQRLVTDWYEKQRGTPWEGGPMPWLYQKYAGHDINRDAFMMNLAENRNLARFMYSDWHPQVFLTMHQMEDNGPRFFVPPNTDPIDPNSDPLIWRSAALLGGAMALELQRERKSGVVSSAKYDYYWPGFEDSAPIGHNTVCLLTEVASVDVASPVNIPATELRAGFKGLPDYRPQINFPDPWPGGRWSLRDIVDYDLTAVRGLLHAASAYREQLVLNFYDMGLRAIEKGREGGPFAFLIPPDQHDPYTTARLERLLLDGAIEIQRALEPFRADGDPYPEGTDIIFMTQPYRAYVKTLLERQSYPARRSAAGASPERPYDVAGWTLPLQMGAKVITIERRFEPPSLTRVTAPAIAAGTVWGERKPAYWVMEARGNAAAIAVNRLVAAGAAASWTTVGIDGSGFRYAPGSIVVPYVKSAEPVVAQLVNDFGFRADGMKGRLPADLQPIGRARVALYKPWTASIDEGWTRLVLEQYEFKYTSLTDKEMRAGNLRAQFDAIVLPNVPGDRLASGLSSDVLPPEYAGGLGAAGIDALRAFVRAGGSLICLGQSGGLAIGSFELPVRDVARESDERLFVPGSIVRLTLDPAHPLSFGMAPDTVAFFAFSSVYSSAPGGARPYADPSQMPGLKTVARYGDRDLLLSGWLEGGPLMAGRAAIVEAAVGSGRVVLFGFPVQHRAQSHATFRLLFNALFTSPSAPAGKKK